MSFCLNLGTTPLYKRLRTSAIPHIFARSKDDTLAVTNRRSRAHKRMKVEQEREAERQTAYYDVGAHVDATEIPANSADGTSQINIYHYLLIDVLCCSLRIDTY